MNIIFEAITSLNLHNFIDVFRNAVYITGLIIIMMLVIEHLNVVGNGSQFAKLKESPFRQVVIAATLGLIPGCMGGFAAVSLFTHQVFGFGALLAALISDTGDETFYMLASLPFGVLLLIKGTLFIIAVCFGYLANKFIKLKFNFDHSLELHTHDHTHACKTSIKENIRHISKHRLWVSVGILIFIISLASGQLEHDHHHAVDPVTSSAASSDHANCTHDAVEAHQHTGHEHHAHDVHLTPEHSHGGNFFFSERWVNLLFVFVALAALYIVLSTEQHFLEDHIIKHVIKKHFLQIFLWTFGSLLLITALQNVVGFNQWIGDNQLIVLLIALLVGIIPQSGPHLLFISLFISGGIGLSIVLANSIVQSGHSGLPLLASSKKGFVMVKLCALGIGGLVGLIGYLFGF